jgi:pimeloyl-ACP methyl ester carboxylesterase
MSSQVILLPGGVMPAPLAYADLIAALGSDVEAVAKELEMYAGPEPPPGYALVTEVYGIRRAASEAGFDRFHLVGYPGGGASSLAFAAAHPERLLSLSLIEPAWLGNEGLGADEQAVWRQFERIMDLSPDQSRHARSCCGSAAPQAGHGSRSSSSVRSRGRVRARW